ncbi:hypothetical protein TRFO_40120 [Tritrichomonas foetus]|uniref:PAS domain-containing protein n=1 Tax=Tritrichomonas foetus TaxID=1144522 RepID=A0A1J4J2A2_9EUKA|nr:hypothetical protein TRFO_40120 [Tritrichomonas foetus]|eukprot:OHS93598.1 hypothetical protein TRFO_40120 [Tritrichomonas foetus]
MQRECQPSRAFRFLTDSYPIFQILLVSLWPHFNHEPAYWEELLINIFFFHSMRNNDAAIYIMNAAVLSISYFSILLLVISISIYYFNKIAIKSLLTVVNYFLHMVNPILIIPLGFKLGATMSRYSELKISAYLSMSIFMIFIWIVFLLLMTSCYFFDANTIFINDSLLMSFNGIFQSTLITIPSLISFLSFTLPMIRDDLKYIVIALHIICLICFIIYIFRIPFGAIKANIIFAAILTAMIPTDILCYTPLLSSWIKVAVLFGVAFIAYIFYYFFFKKFYFERVLKKPWDKISDCFFILRLGMMLNKSIFLNGDLIEHISQNISNANDRIDLSRFLCYFPEFQPLFVAQMAMLRKNPDLTFGHQFILFQLRQLEIGRQRQVKFEELHEICEECESISYRIRTIWNKLTLTPNKVNLFHDLENITRSTKKTKHKFLELISQYPNNSILSGEFARYLAECEGDYIKAAEWSIKSNLLQEGKVFDYDVAIVHFLKFYQFYAKVILPKATLSSLDDIEIQTKLDSLSILIKHPKIRVEMQRATLDYFLITKYVFILTALISLIAVFLFWILYISLMRNIFNIALGNHRLILDMSELAQSVSITFINLFFQIGSMPSIDRMPPREILENLSKQDNHIDKPFNYAFNFSKSYMEMLSMSSESGLKMLNTFHYNLIFEIITGNSLSGVKEKFFYLIHKKYYYLNRTARILSDSSLQCDLVLFFSSSRRIAYQKNDSWIYHIDLLNTASAGNSFLDQIDYVIDEFLNSNIKFFEQSSKRLWISVIPCAVIYCIISIIIPLICYLLTRQHYSKVQNALQLFSKEVMEIGTNHVVETKSYDEKCEMSSHKTTYASHFSLKIIILSIFLSLVVLVLLILTQIMYMISQDDFNKKGALIHYSSYRACLSLEVLYAVLADNIYDIILPLIHFENSERLDLTISLLEETHKQCSSGDYGKGKYAKEIHSIRTESSCSTVNNSEIHEMLACLPIDPAVNRYIEMAKKIKTKIHDPSIFNSTDFINFLHLEVSHLFYDLNTIPFLIAESLNLTVNGFSIYMIIIGVLSMIISILIFELHYILFCFLSDCHKAMIAFISRIPPDILTSNNELMSLLLNFKQESHNSSSYQKIIFDSQLPVLFINREMRIETSNAAFSSFFGYDSNYINSQSIELVINDQNVLTALESLKYNVISDISFHNITCIKENHSIVLLDIKIIPIYDNSKVNKLISIAIVFIDQNANKRLIMKCQKIKEINELMSSTIFPKYLINCKKQLLSGCSICLIKLQGFQNEINPGNLLSIRQKFYEEILKTMKIYHLLSLISLKNGIFSVAAVGSHDPTDLVIECLNFAFTVSSYFENESMWGNYTTVINAGNEIDIDLSSNEDFPKIIISGNVFAEAEKLLMMNNCGHVCLTEKAYQLAAQHDIKFSKVEKYSHSFYYAELNENAVNFVLQGESLRKRSSIGGNVTGNDIKVQRQITIKKKNDTL